MTKNNSELSSNLNNNKIKIIEGKRGKRGKDGLDGINGLMGLTGPTGSDGYIGMDGSQGPNGMDGVTGPSSLALVYDNTFDIISDLQSGENYYQTIIGTSDTINIGSHESILLTTQFKYENSINSPLNPMNISKNKNIIKPHASGVTTFNGSNIIMSVSIYANNLDTGEYINLANGSTGSDIESIEFPINFNDSTTYFVQSSNETFQLSYIHFTHVFKTNILGNYQFNIIANIAINTTNTDETIPNGIYVNIYQPKLTLYKMSTPNNLYSRIFSLNDGSNSTRIRGWWKPIYLVENQKIEILMTGVPPIPTPPSEIPNYYDTWVGIFSYQSPFANILAYNQYNGDNQHSRITFTAPSDNYYYILFTSDRYYQSNFYATQPEDLVTWDFTTEINDITNVMAKPRPLYTKTLSQLQSEFLFTNFAQQIKMKEYISKQIQSLNKPSKNTNKVPQHNTIDKTIKRMNVNPSTQNIKPMTILKKQINTKTIDNLLKNKIVIQKNLNKNILPIKK